MSTSRREDRVWHRQPAKTREDKIENWIRASSPPNDARRVGAQPRRSSRPKIQERRSASGRILQDEEKELYRVNPPPREPTARVKKAMAHFDAQAQPRQARSAGASEETSFSSGSMSPPMLSSESEDEDQELTDIQAAVLAQFSGHRLNDHTCTGPVQALFMAADSDKQEGHTCFALYGGPRHVINGVQELNEADRSPPHLARRAPLKAAGLLRRAELRGVILALRDVAQGPIQPTCVHICVSSSYVAKAWGTWIPQWEAHGWPGEDVMDGRVKSPTRPRTPTRTTDPYLDSPSNGYRMPRRMRSTQWETDSSTDYLSSETSGPATMTDSSSASTRRSTRRLVDEDMLRELAELRSDLAEMCAQGGPSVHLYQIERVHNPADALVEQYMQARQGPMDAERTPRPGDVESPPLPPLPPPEPPTSQFQAMAVQPTSPTRTPPESGPVRVPRRSQTVSPISSTSPRPPTSILRSPPTSIEPTRIFSPPRPQTGTPVRQARPRLASPLPEDALLASPTETLSPRSAMPSMHSPRTPGHPRIGPAKGGASHTASPLDPRTASYLASPTSASKSPRRPSHTMHISPRPSVASLQASSMAPLEPFNGPTPKLTSKSLPDTSPSNKLTTAALQEHDRKTMTPESSKKEERRRAKSTRSSVKSESTQSLLQRFTPRFLRRDSAKEAIPALPDRRPSARDEDQQSTSQHGTSASSISGVSIPAPSFRSESLPKSQSSGGLAERQAALAKRERELERREREMDRIKWEMGHSRYRATDQGSRPMQGMPSKPATAGHARANSDTSSFDIPPPDEEWLWESNLRRPTRLPTNPPALASPRSHAQPRQPEEHDVFLSTGPRRIVSKELPPSPEDEDDSEAYHLSSRRTVGDRSFSSAATLSSSSPYARRVRAGGYIPDSSPQDTYGRRTHRPYDSDSEDSLL